MSELDIGHNIVQVTAPHTILSKANFTPELYVYRHNNVLLNIVDSRNPDKITIQVTKSNDAMELTETKPEYKLPWWSNSAPMILKRLDFSKVDGKATSYQIDSKHRLTLLPHQGCWGKVYVLEEIDSQGNNKIICAVKVLLNKRENQEEYFRQRHKTEIENNLISNNLEIAIKTYAILENDPDHYLVFLEYGEHARDRFAKQPLDITLQDLNDFIKGLDLMHKAGYAHGDLNLGNLLYVGDKLKLCDWYSLTDINKKPVNEYRYIGNNLPPEAIRAFYYDKILQSDKEHMEYAIAKHQNKQKAYWLHPVSADRFCLGVSLMEIVSPDLNKLISEEPFSECFNLYSPTSLEFWPKYAAVIKKVQHDLFHRSRANMNSNYAKMLTQIIDYIDLDPMQRL